MSVIDQPEDVEVIVEAETIDVTIEEVVESITVSEDGQTVVVTDEPFTVVVEDTSSVVVVTETSVEIIAAGEQGPQGIQGPKGDQGDQGIPGSGGSSENVTVARTAAITMSGHRAVTPLADGTVTYADRTTIGNQPVWITTQAADSGDEVDAVVYGEVTEVSWSWSPGVVFLGSNGALTQTEPPSGSLVIVGEATAPTVLFVDRVPTLEL